MGIPQGLSLILALTWDGAVAWAEALEYGGHTDWRLARMSSTSPTDSITVCNGTNEADYRTSGNELGYMFFHNLPGAFPKTGDQGPFTNITSPIWSGSEYAPNPSLAWTFYAANGRQDFVNKGLPYYAVGRFAPDNAKSRPSRDRSPRSVSGAWGC